VPQTKIDQQLMQYSEYLHMVRGLAPSTTASHLSTVRDFLSHVFPDGKLKNLKKLTAQKIETFVKDSGSRVGRGFLQHIVARVRSFLRYLAIRREAPVGLDTQIDTPRVYREEKLPRSLSWKIVRSLLRSIDRTTAIGKRDYAILLLIATYGRRCIEVASLRLDDIDWRAGVIRIFQRKTDANLSLPLTDNVGQVLLSYLKRGRPSIQVREIFVRHRAPAGILKPAAISDIFQTWSARSGLDIPFQGAHCLRHS
jgi:site-specific recombinase XerD